MSPALRQDRRALLVIPAAALLLAAFVYPVFWLLLRSASDPVWGLHNYTAALGEVIYLKVLWNTVAISGATMILCLLFGYPLAYTMVHARPAVKRMLIYIVLIPFWTSILVRTFAWLVLLQPKGLINDMLLGIGLIAEPLELIYNRTGVLIGMVQILLPFMVFPLFSVLSRIDGGYMKAAANLGAPPLPAFFRVYLPLSLPGVLTGSMLVFIISLGYFITPALLGGRRDIMVAQLIQEQIDLFGNWGLSAALAMILLAGTALIFTVTYKVFGVKPDIRA